MKSVEVLQLSMLVLVKEAVVVAVVVAALKENLVIERKRFVYFVRNLIIRLKLVGPFLRLLKGEISW